MLFCLYHQLHAERIVRHDEVPGGTRQRTVALSDLQRESLRLDRAHVDPFRDLPVVNTITDASHGTSGVQHHRLKLFTRVGLAVECERRQPDGAAE